MNENNESGVAFQPVGEVQAEIVVPSAVEGSFSENVESSEISQPSLGVEEKVESNPFHTFICGDCHTTFSTINEAAGSHCLYCGGNKVTPTSDKSFQEYFVVPFVDTLKDAVDIYKKKIRLNPLIPFSFRGKNILNSMRKIYVPCTLYDISVGGSIVFLGADKISNVKGAPTQKFEILYSTSFAYDNLLAGNYSKMGDEIISAIQNYNFASMTPFQPDSVQDSFLIASDIENNTLTEKVQDKVNKHCVSIVRGNVNHELKKVSTNNMVLSITSAKSLLIPMYFLNLKYKGKHYIFVMNGQTGEAIVDLPIGVSSVVVFSILTFAVIFLVVYLFALFF